MAEENKIGLSGIGVPPEVFFNCELSSTEKNLFGLIRVLSLSNRGCYASNLYLAQIMMCGTQAISNSISRLSKIGYIDIYQKKTVNGIARKIFINDEYQKLYRPLVEKAHEFISKKWDDDELLEDKALKNYLYPTIKKIIGLYNSNYIYKDNNKDTYSDTFSKEKDKADCEAICSNDKKYGNGISTFQDKKNKLKNKIKNNLPNKNNNSSNFKRKSNSPNGKGRSAQSRLPRLVEFSWNNCPTTTSHRRNTKTFDKIIRYLTQLAEGNFGQGKHWDKKWKSKLPDELFKKQFTHAELKQGIENLTLYTMEGYWPDDKRNYKSLLPLLYNERTGKSAFLLAFHAKPESLAENNDKVRDKDDLLNLMQKAIKKYMPYSEDYDEKGFYYSVKSIKEYFLANNKDDRWDYRKPHQMEYRCIQYCQYIDNHSNSNVDLGYIGVGSKPWYQWQEYVKDMGGYDKCPVMR